LKRIVLEGRVLEIRVLEGMGVGDKGVRGGGFLKRMVLEGEGVGVKCVREEGVGEKGVRGGGCWRERC